MARDIDKVTFVLSSISLLKLSYTDLCLCINLLLLLFQFLSVSLSIPLWNALSFPALFR